MDSAEIVGLIAQFGSPGVLVVVVILMLRGDIIPRKSAEAIAEIIATKITLGLREIVSEMLRSNSEHAQQLRQLLSEFAAIRGGERDES